MEHKDTPIFILLLCLLICLAAFFHKIIITLEEMVFEEACEEECRPFRYDLYSPTTCACWDENEEIRVVELE